MGFILFICWIILLLLSFHKRKDFFSPLKIYLLNILIFWGDIFIKEYSFVVYLYFSTILLFGVFIYYKEGSVNNVCFRKKITINNRKYIWIKLWLLTIIPVTAQIILIQKMGGFGGYVHSIGLRVIEWQGLGFYTFLIRSVLIINLLYFLLIVKINNISLFEKVGFFLNFAIYIGITLLSGSRSTLLVNFILMFMIYYYFVKGVKIRNFLILGIICLIIALFLGIARNGYSFEDGELETGLSKYDKKVELANFSYGLFPLEKITEQSEITNHYYGLTYISAITNIIPRYIWPDKPSSGGVIFTNEYHNIHGGYSNYSTGFIVEGIINFGYWGGTIVAYLILFWTYKFFINYYKKQKLFISLQSAILFFLIYPNLLFLIPTYLHGEFTTVTHAIFINRVLVIIIFVKLVIPSNVKYMENY